MSKVKHTPESLLKQLGELSYQLTYLNDNDNEQHYFETPLKIINESLGFHISVLYKISNVIDDDLILEVIALYSSDQYCRPDLKLGKKICLNTNHPPPQFINEVYAYRNQNTSAINVPGCGCDIVGTIYMPENLGWGYLLAGDFLGDESNTQDYEVRICEIMCNLLSSVLMKKQFEKLAQVDGLTGLLNSRTIREELEKMFYRQQRKHQPSGAIVLADIDYFKKINDRYGHLQGDSVLQEVGQLIQFNTRKHVDMAGRYGGEEFLLIYENTDPIEVYHTVERLRQRIAKHTFKVTDSALTTAPSLNVTLSFGLAFLNDPEMENSAVLLQLADEALYRSKTNGRNQITVDHLNAVLLQSIKSAEKQPQNGI